MTLTVNGKTKELEKEMTIEEYLLSQQYHLEHIAVEYNEVIIPKEDYKTTNLRQGDVLEILTFMGGGSR